jgi:DNA processing protein
VASTGENGCPAAVDSAGPGAHERRCLVALSLVPGLGSVRIAGLIRHFGAPGAAWSAPLDALAAAPGIGPVLAARINAARAADGVEIAMRRALSAGARIVTWHDPGYPRRLRGIAASPPVLYIRGSVPEDRPAAAIVGTRRASAYGLGVVEHVADVLAARGVIVVSGLARGIDAAAHRAALQAGGTTVGVLACGVDVAYPPEHRGLIEEMAGHGAVLSEAPMGAPPERGAFPARNRLISGLADVVVVAEGDVASGAMITARQAQAQGRPVFAVPGSIYAPGSRGTHRLLAAGARILTSPDDVLAVLAGDPSAGRHDAAAVEAGRDTDGRAPLERRILAALEDGGAKPIDAVAHATAADIAAVATALVALELRGAVRRLPGALYTVNRARRAGPI